MESSSPVVMPAWVACTIASSASATTFPARVIPSKSAAVSIDIYKHLRYVQRLWRTRLGGNRPPLVAADTYDHDVLAFGWSEVHFGGLTRGASQRMRTAGNFLLHARSFLLRQSPTCYAFSGGGGNSVLRKAVHSSARCSGIMESAAVS